MVFREREVRVGSSVEVVVGVGVGVVEGPD